MKKHFRNNMKIKVTLFIGMSLLLGACVNMVFDSARYVNNSAQRQVWRSLAEKGDVEAQYKLGKMLCCGERPKFDNVESLYWYCQAAKAGQRDAQFEVANMFENANKFEGTIIPKDDIKAYVFYSAASKNSNTEAIKKRDALSLRMLAEDIEKAEDAFSRWPNVSCEVPRNLESQSLLPELKPVEEKKPTAQSWQDDGESE